MNICDDVLTIPLPHYFQQHKDEIIHIFDGASIGSYNSQKWQEHFKNNYEVSNDLVEIIKRCPQKISRTDVGYFAIKAKNGNYDDLRRLFLACMIWGWAGGNVYRALKNTSAALSDSRLKNTLENTIKRIKDEEIAEAYEEFKLDGCGAAFFTKFFYFIGKAYNLKPCPLILDSHVIKTLKSLGEQEEWRKNIFAGSKGYIQYICSMGDWAEQLECSADNIEYFMYKEDKQADSKIYIKEKIEMENDKKSAYLPVVKAREFAIAHYLKTESDIIENKIDKMAKGKELATKNNRDYRRALYMYLFECRGIWNDFVNNHWQDATLSIGVKAINKYKKRAQEIFNKDPSIENLLRQENNPSSVQKISSPPQSTTPNLITINLSQGYFNKLEKIAQECGTDKNTIARILIITQLC